MRYMESFTKLIGTLGKGEKKPELFGKVGWYDLNRARVVEEAKGVGKDVGTL